MCLYESQFALQGIRADSHTVSSPVLPDQGPAWAEYPAQRNALDTASL